MSKIWSKNENKILIMLFMFSISVGLWNNFRQLWMQDNGLTPTEISRILSLGTLICVLSILIFSKLIKINKIKQFIAIALFIKILNLIIMYFLNVQEINTFNSFSIISDIILERMIIISIYPLMLTIKRSNVLYGKRTLVEYTGRDLGILVGGIVIGKTIFNVVFDYNLCLLIATIFSIMSLIMLLNIRIIVVNEKTSKDNIFKYTFANAFRLTYIIYCLIGQIAYSIAFGLQMLILTNYLSFSVSSSTKYFLIVGILSDIVGMIALKKLTPTNDYITISIKFGVRFFGYIMIFLTNNTIVAVCAITWSILISKSYENVTDAPYINSIDNDKQLAYTNLKYMINSFGEAVGTFLAGLMYLLGLRYIFGLSALFMLIQIPLAYLLIYQRKQVNIS